METAIKIKGQLDKNDISFLEAAEDRGLTINDIDLGDIEKGQLDTNIDEILFNASEVGIYGPIDTDLGPALFQINAIIDAQKTNFEDAKDELKAEYVSVESRKLINEMISDIDDLLAQGLTLEEIAKDTDMQLEKISYNNKTENGIAAYDSFRSEAMNAKIGGFPELKELSDGGVFALRLDELIEPTLRPFDTVKEQVVNDWLNAENKKLMSKLADELIIKLDNGSTFEALNLSAENVISKIGRASCRERV